MLVHPQNMAWLLLRTFGESPFFWYSLIVCQNHSHYPPPTHYFSHISVETHGGYTLIQLWKVLPALHVQKFSLLSKSWFLIPPNCSHLSCSLSFVRAHAVPQPLTQNLGWLQLQALGEEPCVHHPHGFHLPSQEAQRQLVAVLAGSSIISSMRSTGNFLPVILRVMVMSLSHKKPFKVQTWSLPSLFVPAPWYPLWV